MEDIGVHFPSIWKHRPDERQLQAIIATLEEGIQLWDSEGKHLYSNPAIAALFDFSPDHPPDEFSFSKWPCYRDDGTPFHLEDYPVARVLATGLAQTRVLLHIVKPDDSDLWLRMSAYPIFDAKTSRITSIVSSASDITQIMEQGRRMEQMAHYDALTRLPNRVLLADRMYQAMARSQRSGETLAICMMDLDGFKPVNDTLGHKAGDQLLQEVSHRLSDSIRGGDTAARIGGDEFALLLGGLQSLREFEMIVGRLLQVISSPYTIGEQQVRISASIGVTLYPNDGSDPDLLLRHADQAMYLAKQAGKNQFQLFDSNQDQRLKANRGAVRKIEQALEQDQLVLYYQPKVDCRQGSVLGVEALVRWRHPVMGLLSPAEFLPLIENDNLIVTLGEWVAAEAMRQIVAWQKEGLDITVGINISARQLYHRDFSRRLREMMAGQPESVTRKLEIEIVETTALEDVSAVKDVIDDCRKLGVRFTLDDFGTGFSSLVHLKRLAVDELKIDQSFVRDMLNDPEDLAIVEGVIGMAAAFKRTVVAEGVETIDHILMLLELGCDVMQGHVLSRPMPASQVAGWVRSFKPDPLWQMSSSPRPTRDYFHLLLAEANHRHWHEEIMSGLHHMKGLAANNPRLDDRSCRFGQWYYNEGTRRFFSLAEFRSLELVHQKLHQHAREICENHASLAEGERQEQEAGLVLENLEFVQLLRQFRHTLAKE
ncbi:MAG: EAL domain-containing protein [Alphaproteobacteria bacterium]|nr:EAL domain-containing protein [Alphaproteobacteria bacterium]